MKDLSKKINTCVVLWINDMLAVLSKDEIIDRKFNNKNIKFVTQWSTANSIRIL